MIPERGPSGLTGGTEYHLNLKNISHQEIRIGRHLLFSYVFQIMMTSTKGRVEHGVISPLDKKAGPLSQPCFFVF